MNEHPNSGLMVAKLLKAAEEGDAQAQYDLGVRYATGSGIPANRIAAAEWFLRAEAQGMDEAGRAVRFLRDETEKRPFAVRLEVDRILKEKAKGMSRLEYAFEAAKFGDMAAMSSLGGCFANGQGVEENLVSAYCFWSLAAEEDEYSRDGLESIVGELTPEQVAEGQEMARKWKAEHSHQAGW